MKRCGCWLLRWCLLALSGGCVGFTSKEPCYLPEQVVEVKGLEGEWVGTLLCGKSDLVFTVSARQNSYWVLENDEVKKQVTFFQFHNTLFVDIKEDTHIAFPAMVLGNVLWCPLPVGKSVYADAICDEMSEKIELLPHEEQEFGYPIVTASTEEIQEHLLTGLMNNSWHYIPCLVSKSELPVTSSGLLSREARTRNYFQLLTGLFLWYDFQEENPEPDKESIIPLYLCLSSMTGFDYDEAYTLFDETISEDDEQLQILSQWYGDMTAGVNEEVVLAAKLYREAVVAFCRGESSTEVHQKFIASRHAYLKAQKIVKDWK